MSRGISSLVISRTPIAVIDVETTGLTAGYDRIVELSIVRVEPGGAQARLVLDTLINPHQRVGATYIHGITDAMVSRAPEFAEVLPAVRGALAGCVVAAYNAYFDIGFLQAESKSAGSRLDPPFVCMMYLRSLIGLGRRCRLEAACEQHRVSLRDAHRSARDAMATAALLPDYLRAMDTMGVITFGDLVRFKKHRYMDSFSKVPLQLPAKLNVCNLQPRERAGSHGSRRAEGSSPGRAGAS